MAKVIITEKKGQGSIYLGTESLRVGLEIEATKENIAFLDSCKGIVEYKEVETKDAKTKKK